MRDQYKWLLKEPGPKMIVEALKLYGIEERPGGADNPIIMQWAKELGLKDYIHDSIAWCGLFMAIVAKRAGKEIPKDPLWALNWRNFGVPITTAMLGDVLVFQRPGGGHVGLYIGEDETAYHVLGGNTSDRVEITRIAKSRLKGIRKPIYSIAQPPNVRQIFLDPDGELSHDEA